MPQAEVFANQPTGTVTSGGTTTSSTAFTVTATDVWPAASSTPSPATVFRIVDVANTSEIMLVTAAPGGSGSGQSWTVTRGAEGTTAIAHAANWTCQQVITAGTLGNFRQYDLGGNASLFSANNTASVQTVFSYNPLPQDAPAAGVAYEFSAFGTMSDVATTTDDEPVFVISWNGTALATMQADSTTTALAVSLSNVGWYLYGSVVCLSATSMVAGMFLVYHKTTTGELPLATATGDGAGMAGVTVSGSSGPLALAMNWHTAETSNLMTGTGYAKRVA